MPLTVEQFVKHLIDSRVMTEADLRAFQAGLAPGLQPATGKEIARELVQRKKLTRFQAEMIYKGQTDGLVFGEYVLLDRIGAGGMGQVYKARHRRMDRVVALKVLPPATASVSVEMVKRFQREIRAAARLDHPNIVTVHDAGESNGVLYLVMQFIDGRDFRGLIREKQRLSVPQAVFYLLQVARGLDYMHREGVVHRDVKPSNLLVDKKGTVKILDMGIARVEEPPGAEEPADTGRLTLPGEVMGSAEYISPEQAEDSRLADARSDIYSLGCTLYYVLTGRPPFPGETTAQKLIAHQESPIPSLCAARIDVPLTLDAVFQKMLAKKPAERFQSMTEVIAIFEDLILEEANEARAATGGVPASAAAADVTLASVAPPLAMAAAAGHVAPPLSLGPSASLGPLEQTILVQYEPQGVDLTFRTEAEESGDKDSPSLSFTAGSETLLSQPAAVEETTRHRDAHRNEPAATALFTRAKKGSGRWVVGVLAAAVLAGIAVAAWFATR